jgi:hypothetical protein
MIEDNLINNKELLVTVDGEIKTEGLDYEDINNEIVFKQPPEAGSVIKVYKRKQNG